MTRLGMTLAGMTLVGMTLVGMTLVGMTLVGGCARLLPSNAQEPADAGRDQPYDARRDLVARDTPASPERPWDGGIDDLRDAATRDAPAGDAPAGDAPSDLAHDAPRPDLPVEIGSYTFDFADGLLTAWTPITNTWSIASGVLAPTKTGSSGLRIPIVLDRSQATLKMRARLPLLDCRGARFKLLDQSQARVLEFGLDYCVPYNGSSTLPFRLGSAVDDGGAPQGPPWAIADTVWHTITLVVSAGSYALYLDGQLQDTKVGPARLQAAFLELGGWLHATPGTEYDEVSIGP